jgi:hypothetical protein
MRSTRFLAIAAAGAAVVAAAAQAATMHPELGAKLSGMGEHGVVNITAKKTKHELCWTFTLGAKGLTGATIRDRHGMIVTRLGAAYRPKACAMTSAAALTRITTTPSSYWVWVATKGHPGDLRGRLFAGMAHMTP